MRKTYKIHNFADLLRVPAERRSDCMRELEYGLALLELSFGDEAHQFGSKGFTWTDDNDMRIELMQPDGKPFLTLATKAAGETKP